jgi:aspartyl protease family protein
MTPPGPWQHPPRPRRASRLGLALWLGAMALLAAMLWLLSQYFPEHGAPLDDAYMMRMVAILAVTSSGLLFIRQVNLKQTARNILLWVGVAGVLLLGYSWQDTLLDAGLRLRSALIPGYPIATGAHEMVLSESEGGSYFVYGTVNDVRVRFLIDTGASEIVLSPADAQRAGIDLNGLDFAHHYETANGIGQGANYTVPRLSVGNIRLSDVAVSIDRTDMSSSLLGMTFLRRLKSFRFGGRELYLDW